MTDVMKIGVEIGLSGNILQGLEAIASKLFGIHTKVKDVEGGFKRWATAVSGAAALFGAEKAFKGFEHLFKHGAQLEHFEAQLLAAGVSTQDVAKATAAAWDNVAGNINASAVESLKNIIELRQATGSLGEAMRMLPAFTKTEMALSSLKDEGLHQHMSGKGQSYDFARSLELLAVTQDEKKLDSFIASMTREMIGMRGLVDGHTFMVGLQNAGGARYGWNEDFVGHVLGPLLQENARNATGLYQLDRSFGSGVMTEMMAQGAEKYGLFQKKDEYRDAHGRWKGMRTGSIAGYDEMRANPEAWALNTVLPLLKSHGVDINDTNAMSKAIQEISRGNKNLGVIMDALLLPASRGILAKERANIDQVPNDASDVLQKNDPSLAMKAFTSAWDNLLTALGKPIVAQAAEGIRTMASAIDALAGWFASHPGVAKAVSGGLIALSAGLAALGTAAVIGAAVALAPGGPIALGILATVAGLGALAALNWGALAEGSKKLWADLSQAYSKGLSEFKAACTSAMDSVSRALNDGIASIPGKVAGAIASMASGIASEIGNALRSIGGGVQTPGTGKGVGEGGNYFVPGAYHAPAAGQRPIIHQTVVHLDGREIARANSLHTAKLYEHSQMAANFDSYRGFAGPDYSMAG